MGYNSNWLHEEYYEIYENIIGKPPTIKEDEFLEEYFNFRIDSPSKALYYLSIYRLKRGWPLFLVHFCIKRSFKKDFAANEQTDILLSLYRHFAKKMLKDVIKGYCKLK